MDLKISRHYSEDVTLGRGEVFDKNILLGMFRTLELPWKDNQKNISCIPEGEYDCIKETNEHFWHYFRILNVPGRDGVLIHSGAYVTDIKGCIIPGLNHIKLNADDILDISYAKPTLEWLWAIMPLKFKLTIVKLDQ